jgi:hypothetical protein
VTSESLLSMQCISWYRCFSLGRRFYGPVERLLTHAKLFWAPKFSHSLDCWNSLLPWHSRSRRSFEADACSAFLDSAMPEMLPSSVIQSVMHPEFRLDYCSNGSSEQCRQTLHLQPSDVYRTNTFRNHVNAENRNLTYLEALQHIELTSPLWVHTLQPWKRCYLMVRTQLI